MFNFATDHIKRHTIDWCKICTYGIFIPWVDSPTKTFFEVLESKKIQTTILVGNNNHSDLDRRIEDILVLYNNLSIKTIDEFHSKCILFSDGTFITGSMNISDSKYHEIGIATELSKEVWLGT